MRVKIDILDDVIRSIVILFGKGTDGSWQIFLNIVIFVRHGGGLVQLLDRLVVINPICGPWSQFVNLMYKLAQLPLTGDYA